MELTTLIEEKYPELYQHLDENPVTLGQTNDPDLTTKNFSDYLESLRTLLKQYIESNEINE